MEPRILQSEAAFCDCNGKPLSYGTLEMYDSVTRNIKQIYCDEALTIPHAHPIQLDADGCSPEVYFEGDARIKARFSESDLYHAGEAAFEIDGWA